MDIQLASKLLLNKKNKLDLSTEEGRAYERERRIALTAITGAAAKVIATAIPLVTVKVSLAYLGEETYGLWAAVISFFSLFAFADLGLGNGLQTELSRATGKDDTNLCCKLISSAYMMLTVVSGFMLLIFVLIYPFINWSSLMNAKTEVAISLSGGVVLAIVVSKILNVPIALVQRSQIAIQEGYKSNIWQCCGSILSLISVYLVSLLDLGPLKMIWVSSLIVVFVSFINMLIFFGFQHKELRPSLDKVEKKFVMVLFKTGIAFLLLSIFTSISLSMDSFIVARIHSLVDATPYSISFKFANFIGIVSYMLATPMWAANGEALERGDYIWVKTRTNNMAKLSLILSLLCSIVLIIMAKPLLGWMRKGMDISLVTLIGMCSTQVAIAAINPYFMVMNAGRVIYKQIFIFSIYTVISMTLKLILAPIFGTAAVAWAGSLCYIVIVIPYTYISAKQVLSGS